MNRKKRAVLSLLGMEKLLKRAGAPRVSEEAKEALREHLEECAQSVCERAIRYSQHAGRRTVQREDVKLASREED